MALLLTFEGLKQQGISNATQYRVCENLHAYMKTKTYEELVEAAIPDLVYLYRSGIVTDDLLAEVDESILNTYGIFTVDANIDSQINEVFVLKGANVTLNINDAWRYGGWRHTVNVMGNSTANISISGNSFCKVVLYGTSTANITVNDTSALCIETRQSSQATIIQNDNSTGDIVAGGDSIVTLAVNGTSEAVLTTFAHAQFTVTGAGTVTRRLYELSKDLNPPILI